MGRKLFYIIILAGVVLIPQAEASLVGYWPFDEGEGTLVFDKSIYGNNASCDINNQRCPEWTDGKYGYAPQFDGVNDFFNIAPGVPINRDFITIAAWIKLSEIEGSQTIFYKGTNRGNIWFKKYDFDNRFYIQFPGLSGGTPASEFFSNSEAMLNEWVHIAVTYDHSYVRFYYNGILDNKIQANGSLEDTEIWESYISHYAQPLTGIIDEVRIYDQALNQQEILYMSGLASEPFIPEPVVPEPQPVIPEPASLLLLGLGLIGRELLKFL